MPRITITVPDKASQPYRFSLDRQVVHFGRAADNDILIDCASISSEHAVMERVIGGYVLTDLASTNGIKLNGELVKKISLRNGQQIVIGDVAFSFELSDEEKESLRLEDPTSQLPPLGDESVDSPIKSMSLDASEEESEEEESEAEEAEAAQEEKRKQKQKRESKEPSFWSQIPIKAPSSRVVSYVVAVLAAMAFILGVTMHFKRATGEPLLEVLQNRFLGEKAPAPEAKP